MFLLDFLAQKSAQNMPLVWQASESFIVAGPPGFRAKVVDRQGSGILRLSISLA